MKLDKQRHKILREGDIFNIYQIMKIGLFLQFMHSQNR
jgi:hypothetical protein